MSNPLDTLLFGEAPDPDVAEQMGPLFERGHAHFRSYIESLPKTSQPMGGADSAVRQIMFVVTRDDFVAFASLCLAHVTRNGAVIHVLCETGEICAVIDRRTSKW